MSWHIPRDDMRDGSGVRAWWARENFDFAGISCPSVAGNAVACLQFDLLVWVWAACV